MRNPFRRRQTRRIHPNTDPMTAIQDHYRIAEARARALGVWAPDPATGEPAIFPPVGYGRWSGYREVVRHHGAGGEVGLRDVPNLLTPTGGTIAGEAHSGSLAATAAQLAALPVTHPDDPR